MSVTRTRQLPKRTRDESIAGCMNVSIDFTLSFNEAEALLWALDRINALVNPPGVVAIPPRHADVCFPAIEKARERVRAAMEWAAPELAEAVRQREERS